MIRQALRWTRAKDESHRGLQMRTGTVITNMFEMIKRRRLLERIARAAHRWVGEALNGAEGPEQTREPEMQTVSSNENLSWEVAQVHTLPSIRISTSKPLPRAGQTLAFQALTTLQKRQVAANAHRLTGVSAAGRPAVRATR